VALEQEEKKTTLGWVVDEEKTPRWAAGGIDPLRPDHKDYPLVMIVIIINMLMPVQ
jgi:hypothetical protein